MKRIIILGSIIVLSIGATVFASDLNSEMNYGHMMNGTRIESSFGREGNRDGYRNDGYGHHRNNRNGGHHMSGNNCHYER